MNITIPIKNKHRRFLVEGSNIENDCPAKNEQSMKKLKIKNFRSIAKRQI